MQRCQVPQSDPVCRVELQLVGQLYGSQHRSTTSCTVRLAPAAPLPKIVGLARPAHDPFLRTLKVSFIRWNSNESIPVPRLSIDSRKNARQLADREVRASRTSYTRRCADASPVHIIIISITWNVLSLGSCLGHWLSLLTLPAPSKCDKRGATLTRLGRRGNPQGEAVIWCVYSPR